MKLKSLKVSCRISQKNTGINLRKSAGLSPGQRLDERLLPPSDNVTSVTREVKPQSSLTVSAVYSVMSSVLLLRMVEFLFCSIIAR